MTFKRKATGNQNKEQELNTNVSSATRKSSRQKKNKKSK